MNSDRLAASQEWRSYRWSVVRNPLYWLTWLPTMLLIVAGRHVEGGATDLGGATACHPGDLARLRGMLRTRDQPSSRPGPQG